MVHGVSLTQHNALIATVQGSLSHSLLTLNHKHLATMLTRLEG